MFCCKCKKLTFCIYRGPLDKKYFFGKYNILLKSYNLTPFDAQSKNFVYTKETVDANSYMLEDIFDLNTSQALQNLSLYNVKVIDSLILGRCFVIRKISKVTIFNFAVKFFFKTNWDVQLFVHYPGTLLQIVKIKSISLLKIF